MKAKVGDWVRFYRSAVFVIGEVGYVTKDILGYENYHTDKGCVREDSLLEIRSTLQRKKGQEEELKKSSIGKI